MGKALYRKYRSKTLEDVVGQEHITETLKNALKKHAISHAYLFTGPRGVGKTSVARILAHEINELPYDEESNHLDIIEIDAASNRRIDEIRDLREKVHIAPTTAKYKVYIIDEVHMLTREAFNALLKTLEEPPEHVIFILATTEVHKVPETIISRTQQYSFKPIDTEHAVLHLRKIADSEQLDITDQALRLIADHGRGSFRDSISMLDQLTGLDNEITDERVARLLGIPNDTLLKEIIQATATGSAEGLFNATQKLREQGISSATAAQKIINLLKDQILMKETMLLIHETVSLMKNLLPATGAQSSLEQIEIALLDVMNTESNTSNSDTKNNDNDQQDSRVIEETESSTENEFTSEPQEMTMEPVEQIVSVDNSNGLNTEWDTVLHALKSKHNTLYGVLRMAEAEIDGDVIRLIFAFEFHKKQLNQNKNLDILHGIITDKLGKKHELEIIVKKQSSSPKADHVKPNDDKAISSVSNIFGGAELLES